MAAGRTEAVEFQTMGLNGKAIACGDLFLQAFNLAILELDDLAATGTDEVVVMTLMGNVVVLGLRTEVTGLGQPRVAEEIEGTIDCGKTEVRVLFGELVVHRLRRDVFLFQEVSQDQLALARQLQLMLFEVLFEHLHFLRSLIHQLREPLETKIRLRVKGGQTSSGEHACIEWSEEQQSCVRLTDFRLDVYSARLSVASPVVEGGLCAKPMR